MSLFLLRRKYIQYCYGVCNFFDAFGFWKYEYVVRTFGRRYMAPETNFACIKM